MGEISDPILNCILEVCCGAIEAEHGLAKLMQREGVAPDEARHAARCLMEYFDLAPKGSLSVFKQEIARLARG